MSQLRDRRQHTDSAAPGADPPDQSGSPPDRQNSAAAAQDPSDPGNGPTTTANPAAEQTRVYKPGTAVVGALRFALRETVYIGAIVVLAVWAAQSYFSQFTPDKVSSWCQNCKDALCTGQAATVQAMHRGRRCPVNSKLPPSSVCRLP